MYVLNNLLLIDIETVPQSKDYTDLTEELKTLWCDKNSKTVPENFSPEQSYQNKAGILAEFGKIICICAGYFFTNENGEIQLKIKQIAGDDEKDILIQFTALCDKLYKQQKNFVYAGHNIREFDIPYICRRMMILQVPLPAYLQIQGAKPWDIQMLDTMQWWKFGDYKNYVSLHLLATVLQVPTSKTDMDGSMVQHVYYKEKNLEKIAAYCCRDVAVVGNIILRFRNLPLLKEEHIIIV